MSFLRTILNLSEKVSHIIYIHCMVKMEREAGFEPALRLGKVGLFSIELFPLDKFLKTGGGAIPKGFQDLVLSRLVNYGGHDQAMFGLSSVYIGIPARSPTIYVLITDKI